MILVGKKAVRDRRLGNKENILKKTNDNTSVVRRPGTCTERLAVGQDNAHFTVSHSAAS